MTDNDTLLSLLVLKHLQEQSIKQLFGMCLSEGIITHSVDDMESVTVCGLLDPHVHVELKSGAEHVYQVADLVADLEATITA